jgi:C4-dicarboxylate transporter DctQ subunit
MGIGKVIYQIFDVFRNVLVVVFFSIIIVSCFVDVGLRYAPWFRALGWTEEVLRYLNVWIILLGASIAVKRKAHLALHYFLRFFRPKDQVRITRFVYVTTLIFLAIMTIFSAQKTVQNIPQQVQAFPISIGWFYMAIPVGSFYMFVDFLLILIYGNHPFYRPQEEE